MTLRVRCALLLLALAILAPAAWHVALALPAFGAPTSRYGVIVNALAPRLRRVSNMVAAVNFDIRGLDTLGEEMMLLGAVTGAVVLLRGARGEGAAEHPGRVRGRPIPGRSDAQVLVGRTAAGLTLLFGLYMILHGTVTPGGGFQGGVVVATSLLLLYLGEGYRVWRLLLHGPALALLEALGALGFVGAAGIPLAMGHAALSNLMPLGTFRDLYSGGLMVVINFAVALAVIGGFANLLLEFLEETRSPESDTLPDEEDA